MNYLINYSEKNIQCHFGNCKKDGVWRRQKTNYEDDKRNFSCYCEEHQIEVDEYWNDAWEEYYRSVL